MVRVVQHSCGYISQFIHNNRLRAYCNIITIIIIIYIMYILIYNVCINVLFINMLT